MAKKKNKTQTYQLSKRGTVIKHHLGKKINGVPPKQVDVAKITGYSRPLVNYYAHRPEIIPRGERSKLPRKYLEKIYELGKNHKTSERSGGMIANIINNELIKDKILNKKGEQQTISKSQVNRILKRRYTPRKIDKVFYLTEEHQKKRVKFCEELLKKELKGSNYSLLMKQHHSSFRKKN